jgi:tetratricopeptide (TPR) repeat protein
MELDGNDARATAIHGYVLSYMFRDHETARMLHERALDISPNMADAWTLGSLSAGFAGDGPTAVERARQGLRHSPLDTRLYWHEAALAQAHYIDGAFEDAVEWAMRAASRAGSAIFNLRTLMASLVALGRQAEAAEVARRLLQIQPKFSLTAYRRRCPFVPAVLEPWLERLRAAGLPE